MAMLSVHRGQKGIFRMSNIEKQYKEKHRFFAFILYPESLPEDWQDKLESLDIPMAISPLHDKDRVSESKWTDAEKEKFKATGEVPLKKPHYHVMYMAKNPVTADAVRKKIQRTVSKPSVSHVEIVDSPRHMHEYLTHDSKDAVKKGKVKYDKKDMVYLNGFDIDRYVTLDSSQKRLIARNIAMFITEHRIINYADLIEHKDFNLDDLGIPSQGDFIDAWFAHGAAFASMMTGFYQNACREQEEKDNKKNSNP